MSTWNKKNFSIYTSDERSALGLIEELGNQTNYNTEELEKVKESDNKKVSHDEMSSIYKIDKNADFTGSWHGIKKPTASQEGLQATVDKIVEEDIPNINSQLETMENKKVDKDKLGYYIIDELENFNINDISLCLNKALNEGKSVKLLEKTYYTSDTINLNDNNVLFGCSFKSIIRLNEGISKEIIYGDYKKNITLRNFKIMGNKYNNGGEKKSGLKIYNELTSDSRHIFQDIYIQGVYGLGFDITGGGESQFDNIQIFDCAENGFNISTVDNWFNNISVGGCDGIGVNLNGNNNRLNNIKTWHCDYGVYIQGNRNNINCSEIQDVLNYGLKINGGWNNKVNIVIDTVGARGNTKIDNAIAIISNDSGRNEIIATVGDRKSYHADGTLDYVLETNSTWDNISIICSEVKKNVLTPSSIIKPTNSIRIYGVMNDNTQVKYENIINSDIDNVLLKCDVKKIVKLNKNVQLFFKVNNTTKITNGTNIVQLSSDYRPIYDVTNIAICKDNSDNTVGTCTANIFTNGYIALWDIPENTYKVNFNLSYITNN